MEIYTKDISLTVKEKVMAHMSSTKYIDTKANGETIPSLEKGNFSEMDNFSLKENSRMA
jgi:hypothetical protein